MVLAILILNIAFFASTLFVLRLDPSAIFSGLVIFSLASFKTISASYVGRRFYRFILFSVWLLSLVLTIANWWHYQYFQSYFNYQSLALISDSSESLFALSDFAYTKPALILIAVSGLFLYLSIRFYKKEAFQLKRTAPLLIVLAVGAAVSGTLVYNSVANYRALNMLTLSPAYFSPVHAFFIPLDSNKQIQPEELAAEQTLLAMNTVSAEALLVPAPGRYNVIVIMLESVRASMLGYYNGHVGTTPNFDAFSANNIVARNFYANTNFTVKAETAIWCGIMDHNAKPPLSKYSDALSNLHCLPELLSQHGYNTRFYHGYQSDFYSRDEFLPKVGFKHQYFHADHQADESRRLGWGISDEAMYGLMLDDLETIGTKPFFAHLTTLSSHYPFHWDWPKAMPRTQAGDNTLFTNYRNAVRYEDYAFGQFWQRFQKSPLAENTIVVVTADHGVWTFSDAMDMNDQVALDEQFFRMPLMIYHPDRRKHEEISQVASQIDIAPTLVSMLGVESKWFVGKDLMAEADQAWALMMKSGQLVVRVGDSLCRVQGRDCAGLHQECVAHQFGELFLKRFTDMQACYRVEGDLLRGGAYTHEAIKEPWLQRGFNLINLHNKRAFGGQLPAP